MILGIGQGGKFYYFALQGDFKTGYTHSLDFGIDKGASITHPAAVKWEGGQMSDLNLSVLLVAGALENLSETRIASCQDILSIIETLHDWSLPPYGSSAAFYHLVAVTVLVGNFGSWWFYRKGFIKNIDCTFKSPYEINSGMSMVVEVNLTILMSLSASTIAGKDTIVDQNRMPHRPWKFDTLW